MDNYKKALITHLRDDAGYKETPVRKLVLEVEEDYTSKHPVSVFNFDHATYKVINYDDVEEYCLEQLKNQYPGDSLPKYAYFDYSRMYEDIRQSGEVDSLLGGYAYQVDSGLETFLIWTE